MKILGLLLCCIACTAVVAEEPRSITVAASGEVTAVPDEVLLSLRINSRNKLLSEAKQENDAITKKVLKFLSERQVPNSDIKLDDLDVAPYFGEYGQRSSSALAYDYSKSILLRLKNFEEIEPILSGAFDAGLTQVTRMQFRVSSQRQHQFDARKLAFTHAKEKATHLTELAGMKLGSALRIQEDIEYNDDTVDFFAIAPMDGSARLNFRSKLLPHPEHTFVVKHANAGGEASIDLNSPGLITISADVKVMFEMLP